MWTYIIQYISIIRLTVSISFFFPKDVEYWNQITFCNSDQRILFIWFHKLKGVEKWKAKLNYEYYSKKKKIFFIQLLFNYIKLLLINNGDPLFESSHRLFLGGICWVWSGTICPLCHNGQMDAEHFVICTYISLNMFDLDNLK